MCIDMGMGMPWDIHVYDRSIGMCAWTRDSHVHRHACSPMSIPMPTFVQVRMSTHMPIPVRVAQHHPVHAPLHRDLKLLGGAFSWSCNDVPVEFARQSIHVHSLGMCRRGMVRHSPVSEGLAEAQCGEGDEPAPILHAVPSYGTGATRSSITDDKSVANGRRRIF